MTHERSAEASANTSAVAAAASVPVPARGDDGVFVLFRGGRLPSWHLLGDAERAAAERHHVDLMLSVGHRYGMRRIEGFRLLGLQHDWARFWVIEFPDLAGAEAWIEAETAPPYGLYGHYDYRLARSWARDHLATWPISPRPVGASDDAGPGSPAMTDSGLGGITSVGSSAAAGSVRLEADRSSIVVLLFGRWRPGAEAVSAELRADGPHVELMQRVAREHGLIRIEAFQAIDPPPDWHRAWLIEFPTLAGAEAWMDAEVLPPHGAYSSKQFFLARRWAPDYFATWVGR